jgi:hypothetical protein
MKMSQYVKEYTNGEPIILRNVFSEIKELVAEIFKFNKTGIKEEFEDVLHFVQLWLFWRFGLNGEIWSCTKNSTKKFMDRRPIWREIYIEAGLPGDISNFCGNYKKAHKVVNHLQKFGINKEKAEKAHAKIVLGK